MKRPPITVLAGGLVVLLLLGLAFALRQDPDQPGWIALPADMARSPAPASLLSTDLFPDGLVQREPPEGSIPWGVPPLDFGPGTDEAERAGRELTNPVARDERTLARGRLVFQRICAHCHGPAGRADAPAVQRGVPPPPSIVRRETKALPDGEIFHALTLGRKNMPSMALQTSREDRWKVIHYLRSLQEAP
jgi:mono/diheme cytochrome c family protein